MFKVQAEVLQLVTMVTFLPMFVILPFDQAYAAYTKTLEGLKSMTEITALVLAVPFALFGALLAIPIQALTA